MREVLKNVSSAVEAIDHIINYGVKIRASDIHCDPFPHGIKIRMRIDGLLEEVGVVAKIFHEEMIARLKILSALRTDIHHMPQDGRWRANLGVFYNIRISFMPTHHGENAVMRLLPIKQSTQPSFSSLGFNPDHIHILESAISQTNGLILVTGPTGSGKTTTLHTFLSYKVKEKISIVTLEDPIEYEISNIRQIQIRENQGITFASALRASLRQDPDIIMVGEIRDTETARVAVHTALTGHLVFSTLHTNSALETIPRLMDMHVDPYLLASTLRLVIGQRLVRSICKSCAKIGCDLCRGTGFMGRLVVAEIVVIDEFIKKLILNKSSISEYYEYLKTGNFISMWDDGIEKIEWGMTTQEEVRRVLSE